ncbi:MAG: glycosyltransferase, partial [bacterium]
MTAILSNRAHGKTGKTPEPQRLKVLHVVHQFPPHHRHGAELSSLELARGQQKRGYEVRVLAGEKGRFSKEIASQRDSYQGLDVTRLYFNPRSEQGFLKHPGLHDWFLSELTTWKPDLIHVQHLQNLSFSLLDVAHKISIPTVITLRDYGLFCARTNLVRGDLSLCRESDLVHDCVTCLRQRMPLSPMEKVGAMATAIQKNLFRARAWSLLGDMLLGFHLKRLPPLRLDNSDDFKMRNDRLLEVLSRADCIVAISEDLKERFERFLGNAIRVISLLQTPDLPIIERDNSSKHSEKMRFGFIGKFSSIKGIHLLLDAFGQLPPESATLDIYGSPTWTNLQEIAYWRRMKRRAKMPGV